MSQAASQIKAVPNSYNLVSNSVTDSVANFPPQLAASVDMEAEIDALNRFECSISFGSGMTLREIEKNVILETLKRQNHNRTKTAQALNIGIRTLQRKLKQYEELVFSSDLQLESVAH